MSEPRCVRRAKRYLEAGLPVPLDILAEIDSLGLSITALEQAYCA